MTAGLLHWAQGFVWDASLPAARGSRTRCGGFRLFGCELRCLCELSERVSPLAQASRPLRWSAASLPLRGSDDAHANCAGHGLTRGLASSSG